MAKLSATVIGTHQIRWSRNESTSQHLLTYSLQVPILWNCLRHVCVFFYQISFIIWSLQQVRWTFSVFMTSCIARQRSSRPSKMMALCIHYVCINLEKYNIITCNRPLSKPSNNAISVYAMAKCYWFVQIMYKIIKGSDHIYSLRLLHDHRIRKWCFRAFVYT